MVGLSFFALSIHGIKKTVTLAIYSRHYFFFIALVKLLLTLRLLHKLCYIIFFQMSSLKRNEKIICENCGTQTRRSIFLTA